MKICPKCGIQSEDSLNFCPSCGSAMVNEEDIAQKQSDAEINYEQSQQEPENNTEEQNEQYYSGIQYGDQPQMTYITTPKKTFSDLSVVSFVLSITLPGLTGIILAIIDLIKNKINKKGLSIAAIILGSIKVVISIALTVVIISSLYSYIYSNYRQNNKNSQNPYSNSPYFSNPFGGYDAYDDWEDFFYGGGFNYDY